MPDDPAGSRTGRGFGPVNLALLLLLGGLWGTAFLFITVGLRSFSPILFVAIRFDISGLVLLGIASLRRGAFIIPRGRRQWGAHPTT